jgi:hypothetical protein
MTDIEHVAGGASDASGGAHTEASGAHSSEQPNPQKRAHDAILSELKHERQKRRELEEKMQAVESEKLLEQGKLKEYAESFKARAMKLESELKEVRQNYAFTTVKAQVERKASELGCLDSDLLMKAIDVNRLQVDDTFNVDTQSLSEVIEGVRKEKPFLFKQEGPKFRDANPVGQMQQSGMKKNMTLQEAKEYAAKLGLS